MLPGEVASKSNTIGSGNQEHRFPAAERRKVLVTAERDCCPTEVGATFPSFSRRGGRAINKMAKHPRTRGRGGYKRTAKRTLFCLNLLTAPSAPLRNGDNF